MTNEQDSNEWFSVERLIAMKIPLAKLGEGIDKHNVLYWDGINRRKNADDDSRKFAINLLIKRQESIDNDYMDSEYEFIGEEDQRALEGPLYRYGWFKSGLPDFETINPDDNFISQPQIQSGNYINNKCDLKQNKVTKVFAQFQGLRSNQISFVMLSNKTVKIVFKKKVILANSSDFGLKTNGQGWRLMESASMNGGDLTAVIKSFDNGVDRGKNKQKVVTIISRLNKKLKDYMGLDKNPIINDGGYKFIFKSMLHEVLHGSNVSNQEDALDYIFDKPDDEDSNYSSDDIYDEDHL